MIKEYLNPTRIFMAGVIVIISLLYLRGKYGEDAEINSQLWTSYMTQSCSKTIQGGLKKLFDNERGYWVDVHLSMLSWNDGTVGDYEYCEIAYGENSYGANRERMLECQARYESKYDWFKRCLPVVEEMCQLNGGRC